jgi:probable addiction module antidote protein
MSTKISAFDVSEYLGDEATIAAYLSEIVKDGDPNLLLSAIGDIAKARGMSRIASDSGLGRESLYKALNSDAKPRFDTILRVLSALGVGIAFSAEGRSHGISRKSKKRLALRPAARRATTALIDRNALSRTSART